MKKRKLLHLLWILPLCYGAWWAWFMLADPFERVQKAETARKMKEYLIFYEKFMHPSSFDILLEELLTVDQNFGSVLGTSRFVEQSGKCKYLPLIEAKCKFYESMPSDTVLKFTVSRFYMRRYIWTYHQIHDSRHNICDIAASLRQRCESDSAKAETSEKAAPEAAKPIAKPGADAP